MALKRSGVCDPSGSGRSPFPTEPWALVSSASFAIALRRAFSNSPAGKIDDLGTLLATGQREVAEETGYVADSLGVPGVMHPCIGYSDERYRKSSWPGIAPDRGSDLDHNEFPTFSTDASGSQEAVFRGANH